jgi:hypothetical protein
MITRACEKDCANPQAGAARQNAAVTISMALTSKKLAKPRMSWEELYTFITGRHDWFYYTSTKCAIPDGMS